MSKSNVISNNNSNINLLVGALVTVVASGFSGGLAAGALGMSSAVYRALIGGIIGLLVGYQLFDATDIPKEICALVGSIIGTVLGIVSAKSQEGNEEIDNTDYVKGINCTRKSVQNHLPNAGKCVLGDVGACAKTLEGYDEIVACMGDSNNSDTTA